MGCAAQTSLVLGEDLFVLLRLLLHMAGSRRWVLWQCGVGLVLSAPAAEARPGYELFA